MSATPRVALVSVGVGRVQRGFERWARDLHGILGPQIGLTLWKSAGEESAQERVPPLLRPITNLVRGLPLGSQEYQRDCIAFALGMIPALLRKEYDVIHVIDPPLAKVLANLRRVLPFPARLLYTDGCSTPPDLYPHVHAPRRLLQRLGWR